MAKLVRMKLKIKIESNNKVMPFDQSGDQNVSEIDLKYEEKTNLSLKYMKMISNNVLHIRKTKSEKVKYTELLIKWIFAASVIDRFLFYLTLIYSLSTFFGIILVDPNFYNFN